jgi:ribosomal protein S18 acetylase RimI-like enzyme
MMELRPAVDDDWPRAWAIQREAFLEAVTRSFGGWTEEQVAKCEAAWVTERTRMVWVDGEAVGWIRVEQRADHDWLDLVVIAPSVQGRGLGGRVVRQLMSEAQVRGVSLWLSVHRVNPARRLYRRLGFQESPRAEVRMWMRFPGER